MQNKDSDIHIRWCRECELDWVNAQYRKLEFKPSRLETDRVAIALCGDLTVGARRLIP